MKMLPLNSRPSYSPESKCMEDVILGELKAKTLSWQVCTVTGTEIVAHGTDRTIR